MKHCPACGYGFLAPGKWVEDPLKPAQYAAVRICNNCATVYPVEVPED